MDAVLADLGMSSMQVDDPERGFSYIRDGPLDMRMDRTRGRPAADLLTTIAPDELARALRDLGDEPEAERVAALLVEAARQGKLKRTTDVAHLLVDAAGEKKGWRLHPAPGRWNLHPAARTFQTLRILVNREMANLEQLLRQCCQECCGRAAGPRSSAFTAARTARSRRRSAPVGPPESTTKSPPSRSGRPSPSAPPTRGRGRRNCAGRGVPTVSRDPKGSASAPTRSPSGRG